MLLPDTLQLFTKKRLGVGKMNWDAVTAQKGTSLPHLNLYTQPTFKLRLLEAINHEMVYLRSASITVPFMEISDGSPFHYEKYDTGKMSTTECLYFNNIPAEEDSIRFQYFNQNPQSPSPVTCSAVDKDDHPVQGPGSSSVWIPPATPGPTCYAGHEPAGGSPAFSVFYDHDGLGLTETLGEV